MVRERRLIAVGPSCLPAFHPAFSAFHRFSIEIAATALYLDSIQPIMRPTEAGKSYGNDQAKRQ
jgi:hypothetical protein